MKCPTYYLICTKLNHVLNWLFYWLCCRYSNSKSVSPTGVPVTDDKLSNRYALQKTFTSGIMFVEIGFREEYFCVKMFVLTCMQIGISVNQQVGVVYSRLYRYIHTYIHTHIHTYIPSHPSIRLSIHPSIHPAISFGTYFLALVRICVPNEHAWTLIWYKHVKYGNWSESHLWAYTHTHACTHTHICSYIHPTVNLTNVVFVSDEPAVCGRVWEVQGPDPRALVRPRLPPAPHPDVPEWGGLRVQPLLPPDPLPARLRARLPLPPGLLQELAAARWALIDKTDRLL